MRALFPILRAARLKIHCLGLITNHHALRLQTSSHQRAGETCAARQRFTLADRQHDNQTAFIELGRLNGKKDKEVYFPFCKDASKLEQTIRDKNFYRASPKAIALMRSLKPYVGGNVALRYIHDLDILDKHIMLIPSAGYLKNPCGGLGFDQESLSPRTLGSGSILAKLVPIYSPTISSPLDSNSFLHGVGNSKTVKSSQRFIAWSRISLES